jgi:hypothetical protein
MWSLALVLALGAGTPSKPAPVRHRLACSVTAVRSPQVTRLKRRFSATRIIDLEFDTVLSRKTEGTGGVTLKVFTPNGHPYETLVPETTTDSRSRGSRREHLKARMPVAGTVIITSSLYGRWSVVPYSESDGAACGRPLGFWIGP